VRSRFTFLDLALDLAKNADAHCDQDIAAPESKVRVLVVRASGGLGHRARMLEAAIATNSGFVKLEIQAMIRKGSIADLLLTNLQFQCWTSMDLR
jgi:hypothetical protein